jgi:hypothetical protein
LTPRQEIVAVNAVSKIAVVLLALSAPGAAQADETKTYLPDEVKGAKTKQEGWDGSLVLGASTSLAQNSNVVGVTDGIAWSMGAQIAGLLEYRRGQSEWTNSLKLGETYSYTTALDEFVKTVDELAWKSTYLYHLRRIPWLGPFAELKLKTSILPGYDYQAEEHEYLVQRLDGTTDPGLVQRKYRLSDPFRPLHIEESLGAFAKPIDKETLKLEAKLGFGGKHIFAADQFAVDKIDKDKKQVFIKQLDDVHQGGPAISISAKGSLYAKKVTYYGLAEVMFPAINNQSDSDERNIAELTNVLLEAGLTFKLVSWASLDYGFKAIREPQLLDRWQVQNNLLLTFSYTLVKAKADEKKETKKASN